MALRHLTLLISRHLVPQRVITGNVSSGDADIKQILHLPKRTETRLIRPVRVHNTAKLPEPPFKLRIISSIDDFCNYFSQKLVYGQDRTPNRQYRLRPITIIILDSSQQPLAVGRRVRVFIRPDGYEMPPFRGGDIISRELGDQIREEAYRQDTEDNATEIIVGQEIIQIAGDIIS